MAFGALSLKVNEANAQSYEAFDNLLNNINTDELLKTASEREFQYRLLTIVEIQGVRENKSDSQISDRSVKLIKRFEVSSEQNYISKLINPIWPGGDSGITIGIGYDIGYVSARTFKNDWKDLLPQATISSLESAAGKKAMAAKVLLSNYENLEVPWDKAERQFAAFLPFVIGETETAFPNARNFKSGDCRGALTSLVYNRGSLVNSSDRRVEMLNIKNFMASRQYEKIPAEIRHMKRLWQNSGLPGLIERRELEALLFERGLEDE
jgi:GH24 family phage-related lysozyme (muramidase)